MRWFAGISVILLTVGSATAQEAPPVLEFSHFQIDLGADFSDSADAFTLSAIYGF